MQDYVSAHLRRQKTEWQDIDNVLPVLHGLLNNSERAVLVTLIEIDGGSPRPLGAQMVVSENGTAFGHISGGCLKAEIIRQSLEVLETGENRQIRYGKGSPYIDIVLPCGSGLDLHFDCMMPLSVTSEALDLIEQRREFTVLTDLNTGRSELSLPSRNTPSTQNKNNTFHRTYQPVTRLIVFGTDPAVISLARIAEVSGLEVIAYSSDEDVIQRLDREQITTHYLSYGDQLPLEKFDQYSAAAMFFHDHSIEVPLLKQLVESDCFYIGAQGSKKTHRNRLESLLASGVSGEAAEKIHGPIGLISQTKSPDELAISTLAEIIEHSRKLKA